MKILYLHQYFTTPDEPGGIRSYEMARRLVAAGHEVHMLTSDRSGRPAPRGWSRRTVAGIEVHSIPVPYGNEMPYRRRLWAFAKFSIACTVKALGTRADVVFATSTPLTIAVPALFSKWFRRTPVVLEIRDIWPAVPIAMGALGNPLLRAAALALESVAYRNADAVVGLSSQMVEHVRGKGVNAGKLFCIPNSCDMELFDVEPERVAALRGRHAWLGSRPLVLYAGTFGRVNGVAWLVELARQLRGLGSRAMVVAIGDGMERSMIVRTAETAGVLNENFFVLDGMPKTEIVEWFGAADLCCSTVVPIPILERNSANKVFDALASGTPVLINHGGWQASMLLGNDVGIVASWDDVSGAAEQVHLLLENDERRRAMGARARELGRTEFSRDGLAERLRAVIEGVARGAPVLGTGEGSSP